MGNFLKMSDTQEYSQNVLLNLLFCTDLCLRMQLKNRANESQQKLF